MDFKHWSSLYLDQRICSGETLYYCSQCGKILIQKVISKTTSVITLEKSCIAAHSVGEVLLSSIITKNTNTFTQERSHMNAPIVGNVFIEKNHLHLHQCVHMREKLYHCFQCVQCFAYNSLLQVYQWIHTGVKVHQHSYCGKWFACCCLPQHHIYTGKKTWEEIHWF